MTAPESPADDRPITAGRRFGGRVWGAFLCGLGLLLCIWVTVGLTFGAWAILSGDVSVDEWPSIALGMAFCAAITAASCFLIYRGVPGLRGR